MPDENGNLTVDDVDFEAENFVIPVGDFAGLALPFNDPLLRLSSFITGFDINFNGFLLTPTLHINVLPVWEEYSGGGIVIATRESFDFDHPDLMANGTDSSGVDNNHGTGVAGIVAAEANNGVGGTGIAHGAYLVRDQLDLEHDVLQRSLGNGPAPLISLFTTTAQGATRVAEDGRGGLGTIWVNSAGNGGHLDASTEVNNNTSTFEVIAVAQGDAVDNTSSGGHFGSGIHITGLTGNALSQDSIITTDLSGEAGGVSIDGSSDYFQLVEERGLDLSFFGLDTGDYQLFSGTSAAAPVVSGSVALVLEASGNNIFGMELGWRDVQELLAVSARHMGSDLVSGGDNPFVEFDGLTNQEHRPWTINGADNINGGGFHFSVDYGFGYVDVKGAVRLAETWNLTRHSHNLVTQTETVLETDEGQTFSYGNPLTFEITAPATALDLDVLELLPVFSHEAYREVQISVTSPFGSVSYLFDTPGLSNSDERIADWIERYGEDAFGGTFEGRTILSRQFWGEETTGTWTITIEDVVDNGNEGTLTSLDIIWKGDLASDDDTYYFTDDWALMNEANGGVPTLEDGVGANHLNLAAISGDVHLYLAANGTTRIDGEDAFTLGSETAIALAITGDGNDTLTGTDDAETLIGMRGDDILQGLAGNDSLAGYRGNDSLSGGNGFDTLNGGEGDDYLFGGNQPDVLLGDAGRDTLKGSNGADTLDGGTSFDDISGGNGNDLLQGGGAGDRLRGDPGADTLDGGAGPTDQAYYFFSDAGVNIDLKAGTAAGGFAEGDVIRNVESVIGSTHNDTLAGLESGSRLVGAGGHDQLTGRSGNDRLEGGNGNDTLTGGAGTDLLSGGRGEDRLVGGGGDDTLSGGIGADVFVFSGNHGMDIITDFNPDVDTLSFADTVSDFSDLASVKAAATETNVGGAVGLLIDTGDGNGVFLVGLSAEDLVASLLQL